MSTIEKLIELRIERLRALTLDTVKEDRRHQIKGGLAELYLMQAALKLDAMENTELGMTPSAES